MTYIVRYLEPNCRVESLAHLEADNWNQALEKATDVIDNLNKESDGEYWLISVQKIDTLKNWSKIVQ